MPIDPSIPLQGIPVQSPVDRFAKLMQLKSAMQQQEIGGQQLQAATIENQQRQLLFNDQAKISQLLSQPDVAGDIGKAIPLMGPAGVSGQSILNYASAHAKLQSEIANTRKANADAEEATTKVKNQHLLLMGKTAQAIKDADYAPGAFFAGADAVLAANPALKPQVDQQRAQVMALSGDPLKQRALIQQLTDGALASSGEGDRIAKERAETAKTSVEAQQHGASLAGQTVASVTDQPSYDAWRQSLPPGVAARIPQKYSPSAVAMIQRQGMTAGEQTTTDQAARNAAETARHNTVEERQGQQRVGLEGAKVGLERQRLNFEQGVFSGAAGAATGGPSSVKDPAGAHPEALANVPPLIAEQVRQIANYQQQPPSNRAGGMALLIKGLLAKYYPDYDATKYGTKQAAQTAFVTGSQGDSVNAINTTIGHLGVLKQAAEALNNGNLQMLNRIGNEYGVATGKDPVTTFRAIQHRVAPELVKAYSGTGGGEGDRRLSEQDFNENASSKQLQSAISTTGHLLESKIKALEAQANRGMVKGDFLSDEAKTTLNAITGKALTVRYGGHIYSFPSQEKMDAFKKDQGIK